MLNGRELLECIYAGEIPPYLPIAGLGPWVEARERWEREGLPAGADCNRELGLTSRHDEWMAGLPLSFNMVPAFPIEIHGRDAEFVTLRDEFGVTKRLLTGDFDRTGGYKAAAGATSSMAQWLDFPVKDLRSWKSIYEARFRTDLAGRLPADWATKRPWLKAEAPKRFIGLWGFPFFGLLGPLREVMGLEGLIFAMVDDPAFVHTMVDDMATFLIGTIAGVVPDVPLDQVTFFEDMCATKAPLVSPAMFREFFAPGYRKITGALRELGVRHQHIDTDGNAWNVIPEFIACGLTGTSPCEAQADMDVGRLRECFPEFVLAGGIDKRALVRGPAAIDAELKRRFTTAWTKSRYTPSLDHGAPPDISWANAQHYARRVVEFSEDPKAVR